jgi:hypothetical protein
MTPDETIARVATLSPWRVVTPYGHHDVPTILDHGEWRAQCPTGRWYGASDPRLAVMAVALKSRWPVCTILSPYEIAVNTRLAAGVQPP